MSGSDPNTCTPGGTGVDASGGYERSATSFAPHHSALEKGQEQLLVRNTRQTPVSEEVNEIDEVIVQHRDAGRAVRELPPPYSHSDC